jgi:uncharacterized coiled-coil DUF342 family protein
MSTPRPEIEPSDTDSLEVLEERIHRAVELVSSLRAERDAAVAEAKKLWAEIEGMRSERKQVRVRIEKLLGQMDQLSER